MYSFMIDIHKDHDDLYLCHGSCDTTPYQKFSRSIDKAEVWLQNLYTIMSRHTKEIITLHLETKGAPSNEIYDLLRAVGLDSYL